MLPLLKPMSGTISLYKTAPKSQDIRVPFVSNPHPVIAHLTFWKQRKPWRQSLVSLRFFHYCHLKNFVDRAQKRRWSGLRRAKQTPLPLHNPSPINLQQPTPRHLPALEEEYDEGALFHWL